MDGCKYSKKKGCSYDCATHAGDKKSCKATGSEICRWKKSNQKCLTATVTATTCGAEMTRSKCNKSALGCKWNTNKVECRDK